MKYLIIVFTFFVIQEVVCQVNSDTVTVLNLGSAINTASSDLNPKITADGKKLFFTRRTIDNGILQEFIWLSELGKDGKWSSAKILEPPFNLNDKNSICFVSIDGNEVVIKGIYRKASLYPKERGYSVLKQSKNGWTFPEAISIDEYATLDKGLHNGMAMTANQEIIISTLSEIKDSKNNDLYVSFKKNDGKYTKPQKLAPNINSVSNEFSPFIASDATTLFFASDREGGIGETDIWISKRLDSTWLNWSNPVNLGAPVNTKDKEGYYSLDASSKFAFAVSDKNSFGEADIIRIKLRKEQQANPVVLVTGKVLNRKTNKPIESKIKYLLMPEGTKAGEAHTDPITGEYKIILPYGRKYEFFAGAHGYLSETSFLDLTNVAEYQERKIDLGLVPIEVGQVVKMNNIFLNTN